MTFDECLTHCIHHRDSPRMSRWWLLINIGSILITAVIVGILYAAIFGSSSIISLVVLAIGGGLIVWFGAMLEAARRMYDSIDR